jgi:hypothetical protein
MMTTKTCEGSPYIDTILTLSSLVTGICGIEAHKCRRVCSLQAAKRLLSVIPSDGLCAHLNQQIVRLCVGCVPCLLHGLVHVHRPLPLAFVDHTRLSTTRTRRESKGCPVNKSGPYHRNRPILRRSSPSTQSGTGPWTGRCLTRKLW